ncbi:MAG: SMP-30/gluconolactonase/LRE family protein [Sphingomonadales bacterium]|nr:MAG: SMP-30/gluconolactonase/LRE family protein [Sphingomonadales bacterium]TNF03424.1 MAG: SMP-30/gluconolactonase/LRE family protein [Sphingomonadales bacterium]
MKIHALDAPRCLVGEGPVWDVEEQALYYVDIVGKKVHRLDHASGATRSWDVPGVIGSMALRRDGGALVALVDGFYNLDLETGEVTPLYRPEGLDPRVQFNDGKVDRRGRFVVGTTDSMAKEPLGTVYSFDADHRLTPIDRDIIISNGPCWSPDNRTFYFSDSRRFSIYAYDYDIETGQAANRRLFATTQDLGGIPDGATVDADGLMWMAICEGGKVVAFRPDGKIERIIDMPGITLTASVMFGGPDLDLLYVTSIDPVALKALGMDKPPEELGGRTFVIEGLGARGLPEPRFAG